MNVLVTGGAGYVGSHVVKRLRDSGHNPVIYDNLAHGHRKVASILGIPAVYADIADAASLVGALRAHRIECVMHFAALSEVGESVRRPLEYYRSNVALAIDLLAAMDHAGVGKLVFSSTCAVYGMPQHLPISEDDAKSPMSPYARGKLMVEQIIADYATSCPEFAYATLRYVNAAGSTRDGSLGEVHVPETHLVPLLVRAIIDGTPLTVYGSDYPTPDGTAIRDYVHVDDIADAHIRAVEVLRPSTGLSINLGTGHGFSVLEMIDTAERVSGKKVARVGGPARPGDPAAVYASGTLAAAVLGWVPERSTPDRIVESALQWYAAHPRGYQ